MDGATYPAKRVRAGSLARAKVLAIQLATVVGALLLWELVSRSGIGMRELFPSLADIAAAIVRHVGGGQLYPHLLASAQEVGVGFLVGGSIGLAFGLAVASNRFLRHMLAPVVQSLSAVPYIILFPIFILAFGIGTNSKTAMAAASAFTPVAVTTIGSVYQVKPIHVRVAQLLGANKFQTVLWVYVPSMLGLILSGLRLGMATAIVGVLLAETKLARVGLGMLVVEYYARFQLADMYAILIIVFVIAAFLNWCFSLLTRLVTVTGQQPEGHGLHI